MSDSILGRPLWYELLTTDIKAAEKFYTTVVGWKAQPFEGAGHPYMMLTRQDGTPVAGIMNIPAGMNFPPHWGMYIGVPKLEEGVKNVERLGGKSLSPVIEVPNVGRMRTMLDPHGAAFSIYEPSSPPQQPFTKPGLGDVSWHELYTTDAGAAKKFYLDLFNWNDTESMDMGPMGTYHMFGMGKPWSLGGMMNKPKEMGEVPNHWLVYFNVPDVNAAEEKIKANGGKVLNKMEVPGGDWIVQGFDPQGAAFAIHQFKK